MQRHSATFPEIALMQIRDFGGWRQAQARHFANGALFDQIYRPSGAAPGRAR
jgi:sulfate transport system substrate-binding protein